MPRRAVALALLATLAALLAQVAPARASTADESAVRARLAEVAARAAADDAELARLDAAISYDEHRSEAERAQLAIFARVLYEQPASPLLVIAGSPNLGEAVTRISDLVSAAEQARKTRAALDRAVLDQALQQQRLVQVRARLQSEREDLAAQYRRLLVLDAAASGPALAGTVSFSGSIPDVIHQAWAPLGSARAEWAVRLAQCESGLNPYAFNRSSGASGLFQFLPSTWATTPWRDQSPFDASANALAAAWLYNRSGASQWQCSYQVGF